MCAPVCNVCVPISTCVHTCLTCVFLSIHVCAPVCIPLSVYVCVRVYNTTWEKYMYFIY